ncbi:MAG: helix-turn-helix transcriptional regulator [Planctomycetes bacterium]|nr:helix-turn-helix transcriptional regulator [Planctomycetota bacterium]
MTRTKKVNTLGARLRTARKAKAWSRAELARRANVNEGLIVRWETSGGSPRSDLLARVAAALGVTMDALMRGAP